MTLTRRARTDLFVLTVAVAVVLALGCARNVPGREYRWTSHGAELVGTLAVPDGAGPHPLVVFVPGSGCLPRPRAHALVRAHVEHLTERGVAVFVYDKRGCGESQGDWREVGLEELADDVLAALPDVVAAPKIDGGRIGLLGLSQGAWVSLIAAEKSDQISFIIMLSGPPMTPAEQGHAIVELRLRAKGHDAKAIAAAVALDRMVTQVYRTDSGWDEARAALAEASSEPWFADAGMGIQSRDLWNWQWLRTFMDYSPMPSLRDLPIPIFAVYGERDLIVPAERSRRIIDELAPTAAGPRAATMIEGVGHELRHDKDAAWPPEYWAALDRWLSQQSIP